MDIQNNNVSIQIAIKDQSGKPLRPTDCDVFVVHVYTDNPKDYITFSKRDMLMTEWADELVIPKHQMENLRSGVVCYTVSYLPKNHQCVFENDMQIEEPDCQRHPHPHWHENLIHSKPVVTPIYWRNIHTHHHPHPLNSVTLFDIERLQRELDNERIMREKDIEELQNQFGEGFSDRLDAEIERSKSEDERINATLEALGLSLGELEGNVGGNQEENKSEITQNKVDLAAEIARATNKEIQLQQAIDGEISRAKSQEEVISTTLQMEKERATANESNINDRLVSLTDRFDAYKELSTETLKSEIERAKATESQLNERISGVVNDLAVEVSRSAQKDIDHTNLVVTESNRAQAVENKISTDLETEVARAKDAELHLLNEVHGIQETVSNLATADNTYKKTEVDNLVNGVKNDLSTLENTVNNHLSNGEELTAKVSQISTDLDKAKSDILVEVAKCDAENDKLATELKTLSDSVYSKAETDGFINDINSSISSLENWKNNHNDNTEGLTEKVNKLVADTEKLSSDLSTETTNRINSDTVLQTKVEVAEGKVDAEIVRAQSQESLLEEKINELKSNADSKHAELADNIAETNANLTLEIAERKAQDKVLSDALAIVNGDSETSGSIKKSLADGKAYTDAEIAKLSLQKDSELSDTLKLYATNEAVDKKISDVIGTAPEALDTLGKISNALSQDNDAISAINEVLSGKANSSDVYLKTEVDIKTTALENAISTLETKSDNADSTINERINDLVVKVNGIESNADTNNSALSDAISAEETARKAQDKVISDKLDSEVEKLTEKVNDLNAKIIADIADSSAKDTELEANISALNTLLSNVETKIDNEILRATEKDNELVAKDTALEAKIDANILAIETESNRSRQVEKELNDKINSINLGDTNSNLSAEIDRATAAESAIQSALDAEIIRAKASEKINADNIATLQGSVSSLSEAVNNQSAKDTELESKIGVNETAIADEVSRAKQAEKDLSDRISAIDLDGANSLISQLNDKIDSEVSRATASEKVNSDNIATLQSSVNELTENVNSQLAKDVELEAKVTANTTAITDEIARSKQAEKTLSDKIDAIEIPTVDFTEVNNAISTLDNKVDNVQSTLQTAISNEVSRASAAEKANADNITKLSGDIKAVDDKVNAIDFTPVTNAVSALETKIDNEISRATNAEGINATNIAALQSSVSGLTDSVTGLSANLSQLNADSVAKDTQIESDLATEKTRAENAEKALSDKIDVINGDKDVVGSIAHAIHDAEHYADDILSEHKIEADSKYQPKGDYLTEHQSLADYYNKETVNAIFDGYATKGSVSNLAEEIANTKQSIPTKVSELSNDSKYQTEEQVNAVIEGIIANAPAELDTLKEIADKLADNDDAVSAIVSSLAEKANSSDVYSKSEVDAKIDNVDVTEQLADYATKEEVAEAIEAIDVTEQLAEYAKKDECSVIRDQNGNKLDLLIDFSDDTPTDAEGIPVYNKNEVDAIFVTKEELTEAIENIDIPETDLSGYYDKQYIDGVVAQVETKLNAKLPIDSFNEWSETVATKQEVNNAIDSKIEEIDLSDYYNKSEVDAKIPDMSNYYNKGILDVKLHDLEEAIEAVEIPSVEGLASEEWVNDNFATKSQMSGKADAVNVYSKADTYSKAEVQNLLGERAVKSVVEDLQSDVNLINQIIPNKANSNAVYSKEETYSKTEVNNLINNIIKTYSQSEYDALTDEEKNNGLIIIL